MLVTTVKYGAMFLKHLGVERMNYQRSRLPITTIAAIAVFAAVITASPAHAQRKKGPPIDGTMLAQSCMACHGTNGASTASPMPIISGQSAAYIDNTMKAFRDGNRPSTVMGRYAKGYTDAEIAALAKFYSEKPFVRVDQKIDPVAAEAGRKTYERTCKKCHPDNGRSSTDPEYPILAGQWLDDMRIAIADITADRRKVDEKFKAKLSEVSATDIDNALQFFASQK